MADLSNFLVDSKGYGAEGKFVASAPFSINTRAFSHAEVQEKTNEATNEKFVTACFYLKAADENGNTMRFAKISSTQQCNVGDNIPLDKVQAITLTDKETGEVLKNPRIIW